MFEILLRGEHDIMACATQTSDADYLMQVEYATDIVFRRQRDLAPLYETITRTAVHAIKAEHVATFLGRKLNGNDKEW
ncbi:MAG TPA: hypothetical protein ENK57_25565 [Polyangiaceae bacterium]|nr:hypothetical protein [Polyangiaceae bacterium]